MISKEEKDLFDQLSKSRLEAAATFNQRAFSGIWGGIVDKYPETAHFIYELLQNADDAQATEVNIELTQNVLVFRHNGKVHFSVSTENVGVKDYGHINAITGVGSSNKADSTNKIGKFGIGFKSIFQYTDAPYIYDDKFWFKIENYIVPKLLPNDYPGRTKGETIFKIEFNTTYAYEHIRKRLEELENPILFLNNLQKISWVDKENDPSKIYVYSKRKQTLGTYDDITVESYQLLNFQKKQTIWMFSREIDLGKFGKHFINVGYYIDEKGEIDTSVRPNVYCFFNTSEKIGLPFIVHAPFLLIDNRKQLKPDNKVNHKLLKELARLQADSLYFLRDRRKLNENIFDFVFYSDKVSLNREYSLSCFYNITTERLQNEPLILSNKNEYIIAPYAFTTDFSELENLFTNTILRDLFCCYNKYVSEIFSKEDLRKSDFARSKLSSKSENDWRLDDFIYGTLHISYFDFSYLGKYITPEFMERQSFDWIVNFYRTLLKYPNIWEEENNKYEKNDILLAPIILTNKQKWVPIFVENEMDSGKEEINIFFEKESESVPVGCNIISSKFTSNVVIREFLEKIGVKGPSPYHIIKSLLVDMNNNDNFEKEYLDETLTTIYSNYKRIKHIDQQIEIKEKLKNSYYLYQKDSNFLSVLGDLYDINIDELSQIIGALDRTLFLDLSRYPKTLKKIGEDKLYEFVKEIGLNTTLKVVPIEKESEHHISSQEILIDDLLEYQKEQLQKVLNTSSGYTDYTIEGLEEYFEHNNGKVIPLNISKYIWNYLCNSQSKFPKECLFWTKYGNSTSSQRIPSKALSLLLTTPWLLDGKYPADVTQEQLMKNGYQESSVVFNFLDIRPEGISLEEHHASPRQIENNDMGEVCRSFGIKTVEDLKSFMLLHHNATNKDDNRSNFSGGDSIKDQNGRTGEKCAPSGGYNSNNSPQNKLKKDDFPTIINRVELGAIDLTTAFTDTKPKGIKKENNDTESSVIETVDVESILNNNRIEKEFLQIVQTSPKYSIEWLMALLKLENLNIDKQINGKSIRISFNKVQKDASSKGIYLLYNPSRSIPLWLEDYTGLEVVFSFTNKEELKIKFEVASVQDYILRLKAKEKDKKNLDCYDWNECVSAKVEISKQIDLVGNLIQAFEALNFSPNFNLKYGLKDEQLKFIFGPPGTGKTTTIAQSVINQIKEKHRVLVLAPTNRACDEVTRKIVEKTTDASKWLGRFVATEDESLNEYVVDRTSSLCRQKPCCIVSTIARLPFDGFNNSGEIQPLADVNWNQVIIDEASMIPLADILYAIYKLGQRSTYGTLINIVGDPFQIQPIVSRNEWKDENIYSIVNLKDFSNHHTEPINFKVTPLMEQFRSVPSIGEIYSSYMYDGQLKHHRLTDAELQVGNITFKPLNIIQFKVEKYNSIFGVKKLDGSNVHIYSVLLVVELCDYIIKNYSTSDEAKFTIGIICPYAPQAQLINGLIEQLVTLPSNIEISVGTVHKFQGSQCNFIFALFNPPRSLATRPNDILLNNQNIINVAISRASDYLCILMPHKDTEGYENLYELNKLGSIIAHSSSNVQILTSDEVEKKVFGIPFYIESNTFVTSHQLANVYTSPDKKYEVRIDEHSVDIQVAK